MTRWMPRNKDDTWLDHVRASGLFFHAAGWNFLEDEGLPRPLEPLLA